jgi:metallophosphoesterase superfamily enzyme
MVMAPAPVRVQVPVQLLVERFDSAQIVLPASQKMPSCHPVEKE